MRQANSQQEAGLPKYGIHLIFSSVSWGAFIVTYSEK
jgi:hypothetical protein